MAVFTKTDNAFIHSVLMFFDSLFVGIVRNRCNRIWTGSMAKYVYVVVVCKIAGSWASLVCDWDVVPIRPLVWRNSTLCQDEN